MGVGQELAVGELYEIARQLVWRYRHVKEADLEDAAQAAVVEMVAALRQLKAPLADPHAYVRRVAYLTIQAAVWAARSPVHIRSRGLLPQLAAATTQVPAEDVLADQATGEVDADVLLNAARWARQVRVRVREVIGNDAPVDREIARLVLLDDYRPAEAAQETGRSLAEVYVVTQRIKNRIVKDARMRDLWRALPARAEETWE